MFDWLKDTFKKLSSSNQSDLEKEFQSMQETLLDNRQKSAQLIAEEVQLQSQLEEANDQMLIDELSAELNTLREKKEKVGRDLIGIENEVQKAFTKKEKFLAQRKNESEPNKFRRELKIILAILLIWQLIGLILKLRPNFLN